MWTVHPTFICASAITLRRLLCARPPTSILLQNTRHLCARGENGRREGEGEEEGKGEGGEEARRGNAGVKETVVHG